MKAFGLSLVLILTMAMVGCSPKEEKPKPLGEASPEFSGSLKDFVAGDWCLVDPDGEVLTSRYYTFKPDGRFECGGNNGEWKSTGTWSVTGNAVNVMYQTMKGKSFEDYRQEYKKDEEGGGQVAVQRALFYDGLYAELEKLNVMWVDKDKKHMTFSDPNAAPVTGDGGGGEGEMGNVSDMLAKMTEYKLERTGKPKA